MAAEGGRRLKQRFSFLLLEEGDSYVQDWLGACHLLTPSSPAEAQQVKGRLRLCARSLFFQPHDVGLPILLFPFRKVGRAVQGHRAGSSPGWHAERKAEQSRWGGQQEGLLLTTRLTVKMKENGGDAPYVFDQREAQWWFGLEYAPIQQLMQQLRPLLAARELPAGQQEEALRALVARQEASARFDLSRLVELGERVLLEGPATQLTPLVREPGRLLLTPTRLYFQPLHNVGEGSPVRCWALRKVAALGRRTHYQRPVSLELFFADEAEGSGRSAEGGIGDPASALFALRSAGDREALLDLLQVHAGGGGALLLGEGRCLDRLTAAWQEGALSNYEYLLLLNLAAGRSFQDLAQWPVMPWVLADYRSERLDLAAPRTFRDLSKPVGALNPARLAMLRERYRQMAEDPGGQAPFLYGTHYSAPGYVLFWLVRSAPAHMLRLQNGRFDTPDRLFGSVSSAWESVLSNAADVKELTPEFFSPPGDFLALPEGLNLGVRQSGEPVGDVQLPPWASGPAEFVALHARALESAAVSEQLHRWIDLIFGCRQRGEAALAADNLFHPLTYEGAADLDAIADPAERCAVEAQVNEFGQTPRQLFASPHPARIPASGPAPAPRQLRLKGRSRTADVLARTLGGPLGEQLRRDGRAEAGEQGAAEEALKAGAAKQAGGAPLPSPPDPVPSPPPPRSAQPAAMPNGGAPGADSEAGRRRRAGAGLLRGALDGGQLADPSRLRLHRAAVHGVALWDAGGAQPLSVYSVGADAFLKVASVADGLQVRACRLGQLPLAALATLAPHPGATHPVALAGSLDGCVHAYSAEYGRTLGKIAAHEDAVSGVCVLDHGAQMVLTASWDSTLRLWSAAEGRGGAWGESDEAEPLAELAEHEAGVRALDADTAGQVVLSGAEDGVVIAWDMRCGGSSRAIWHSSALSCAVTGVQLAPDGRCVLLAGADGSLRLLEMRQSGAEVASRACGSPLHCCLLLGSVAVAGSEDGGVHFWAWGGSSPVAPLPALRPHSGPVSALAFGGPCEAPVLAAASLDHTVSLHRLRQGRALA